MRKYLVVEFQNGDAWPLSNYASHGSLVLKHHALNVELKWLNLVRCFTRIPLRLAEMFEGMAVDVGFIFHREVYGSRRAYLH